MLDLRPIKKALARISPYPWSYKKNLDGCWSVKDANGWEVCEVNMTSETVAENGAAIAGMPGTIAALVAEVERLRAAIKEHAWMTEDGAEADEDLRLWAVLDA